MAVPVPRSKGWRDTLFFALGALVGGVTIGLALWLSRPDPRPAAAADHVHQSPDAYRWTDQPEPSFPIPPYARFLKDVTVVLDPGHVGQRDRGGSWKRGPTGLREAEVNLRVALFLREFLDAAGARVELTRSRDEGLDLPDDEDLRQRAELANRVRADLFLSIHHNAASSADANHTLLFFHATPDHCPASRCAAGYLLTGLNDALRLETHVECALMSDYAILPSSGYAVLRHARVPAVISEASFHSNPEEEARLRDPLYNRREAYGLFLGLARWAQAGLPRLRLLSPADACARPGDEVTVGLDDGLSSRGGWGAGQPQISAGSLRVSLDGRTLRYSYDARRRELRVRLPGGLRGSSCVLRVDFENTFGQHVLHPRIELTLPN
jgi:N-acetylmuramoyl-L-alanine amidase